MVSPESETLQIALLNNAEAVLLCLHHPSTKSAQSNLPWASSESQFLTHLFCLSLSPPQCHSCLYGSSLGCPCQPICSVPYASQKDCQVNPVLSSSNPALAAGLRPSQPNLVARKQSGCLHRARTPHGGGAAGTWLLARGT